MHAGHLQFARKIELFQRRIDHFEEIVVVEEVGQHVRMDQQDGVDLFAAGFCQDFQLAHHILQQLVRRLCGAYKVAYLSLDVHALGERAQVEADHRLFQPEFGGDDGFFVGYCCVHFGLCG